MRKFWLALTVLLFVFAWFWVAVLAQPQVENYPKHQMWLLRTTQGPLTVYYYKFQVKQKMTCVAVFKVEHEGGTNFITESSWGPSAALAAAEVPCE